jgi:hypothetical protein
MSDEINSRRRGKVVWFIVTETAAMVILLVAGTFVLLARPVDSAVMTALNVVMLAAAGGVATIPIFFFAFAPILPGSGR